MEDNGAYAGASRMLEAFKAKYGADSVPDEVLMIQDMLECIEKNGDRLAHMLKDSKKKRAGAQWDDIKALMCEQDRKFAELVNLQTKLSMKPISIGGATNTGATK